MQPYPDERRCPVCGAFILFENVIYRNMVAYAIYDITLYFLIISTYFCIMEDTKIPFIKGGSQVPITLGTGVIADLQATLSHLLTGRSEGDLAAIQGHIDSKQQLEGWEIGVVTLTRLLRDVQTSAEATGQIEMRSINDVITSVVS